MTKVRIVLIVLGVALLALGAVTMLETLKPIKIVGVASWFLAALILHDGIIAPIVFGVQFLMRKYGKKIPWGVLAIVQGGIVVGSIFSIIVLPAIYKKTLGTKNPTILPFDYGFRFVVLWASIIVLTALSAVVYYALAKRQKARPSVSQA